MCASATPRILLVEDDQDCALLTIRELKRLIPTCEILRSFDGLEAREYLSSSTVPQFIVTDIQMPRMDGIELIAWIKGECRLRTVPIAVLSGSEIPGHREQCYRHKIEGFFRKGEPLVELGALIRHFAKENHLESTSVS